MRSALGGFRRRSVRNCIPTQSVTAIKLSRHTGRDCRYPEHREVNLVRPPWPLGSGIPCRNDGFFLKVISNNESTKTEMNCPRKSRTIPPQITLPSWGLAFLLGAPSPSLAFGWDVLYWISPNLMAVTQSVETIKQCEGR